MSEVHFIDNIITRQKYS